MKTHTLPQYAGIDTRPLSRKMTNDEVRARFEAENATVYNQRLRRWIPENKYIIQLVIKALEPYLASKTDARVLDLGAGAGGLSWHVLRAFKNITVTLVDFSQNMLSGVPEVLSGYEGRYSTQVADFWQAEFSAGGYDAVVASFSLHHGRGQEIYENLYRKIYHCLKAPGIFVCCDVVDGDTPELSAMNEHGWRWFLRRRHYPDQDIERLFSNYYSEDSPLSLRQHLALLSRAGFPSADVLWKRFNFAVYVGIKE
jgi:tRNA (cmo5U34)-methyltransferase